MTQLVNKEDFTALIESNKANGWEDLSDQRKAFAMHFIIGYNHRESAKEVGFNPNKGMKLTREPLLSAFISYLQEEVQISNLITEDFVRTQFINLIPMLSGEVEIPVILPDGEQAERKKFHAGELVNVIKELAKSTKFYEEGSGQSGNVNVNIDMRALLGGDANGISVDG